MLGTPAGERHALPVALLADLVRGAGWEVSDLGCDVPAASFARTVADVEHLAAVGVSISTPECVVAGTETIAALRSVADSVPILVGGYAVRDEAHALALGADGWASDGRAVVALLDALAPGKRPNGQKPAPAAAAPAAADPAAAGPAAGEPAAGEPAGAADPPVTSDPADTGDDEPTG